MAFQKLDTWKILV